MIIPPPIAPDWVEALASDPSSLVAAISDMPSGSVANSASGLRVYMGYTPGERIGVTVRAHEKDIPSTTDPNLLAAYARSGSGDPGKKTTRAASAILYEDDVKTADEVRGQVYAWYDTEKYDEWANYLVSLDLIDESEKGNIELLSAVWGDAVDLAGRLFTHGGKKVTPWAATKLLSEAGGYSPGGSGGRGGFSGTRTSTHRSVDLTDPSTAKAIINDALSQHLGRAATEDEVRAFTTVINSAERANPTLTTTSTTYDKGDAVSSSSTTKGGLTDSGRYQLVSDEAMKKPEYGAVQSATTYFNAFLGALDSPM